MKQSHILYNKPNFLCVIICRLLCVSIDNSRVCVSYVERTSFLCVKMNNLRAGLLCKHMRAHVKPLLN